MSGTPEPVASISPSSLFISSYLSSDYIGLGFSVFILIFWAGYWVVHMIAISYGKLKLHKKYSTEVIIESGLNKLPGVSIIKPLVGVDPNLYSNLETFFTLKYPHYEVLFCMHNDSDPSVMVVDSIRAKYPHVDSRRFTCEERIGINPKINNMIQAYKAAKYDLILISDAGMRMKEDTLTDMVMAMKEDVGVVTQMPFTCDRKGFAATLEKVFFGTSHARIYLSADAIGIVCSTGMSALYRKNVLEEAGGMQAFGHYIAEDYFFAQAMVSRGWKCAISSQPGWQNSGICNLSAHHARVSRWAKLRIAMLPHILILEPMQECVLLGMLSSLAVNTLFQWNSLVFFLVHVTAWMLTDYVLLSIIQNGPLPFGKFEYVVSWLFREFTSLPLFIKTIFDQTISWRTGTYKLKWGGVALQIAAANKTSDSSTVTGMDSKRMMTVLPSFKSNSEKGLMHSVYFEQQQTVILRYTEMSRQQKPPLQPQHCNGTGQLGGFKGVIASLMPKKFMRSVSEHAKIRRSNSKELENEQRNDSRRRSMGTQRYSKDQDLNFSGMGLKSSKGLSLFRNVKKPEMVERVTLDHNRFESLPEELCLCTQLRVLSATDNELVSVPHWIASLTSLAELDLQKNNIQSLPDSLKWLKRLAVLNMSFNPLTSIEHSLMHCQNLTALHLNDCCLQFLPATFGRLCHLQILELRDNALNSLPSGICRLSRLEFLDVGGNRLTQLPDALGNLLNLKMLLADENRISRLPQLHVHYTVNVFLESDVKVFQSLDGLHSLEYLDMSNNGLRELSCSMQGLMALETLLLSDNHLIKLPETLGPLPSLKLLRIDRNNLRQLPVAFGRLQLKEFSATGNELPDLPSAFCQLCQLEVLFLDHNRLSCLPSQLGDLRNLCILSLRGNRIETLPHTIGNLRHLITLDLRENRLYSLPTGLRDLASLRAIWLSHNQATPKLSLNYDTDKATRQRILTCYLLPQQGQVQNRFIPSRRENENGRLSRCKRITFDSQIKEKSNDSRSLEDSKALVPRPEWPLATLQALDALEAQHQIMVRTETSFGSLIREAKIIRSGKISPRLLYQLDKMKNEQQRSIMFQSSALTIVSNHVEAGSTRHEYNENENFFLTRPQSLIRPYAMIDLKTLQAQVDAERGHFSATSMQSSKMMDMDGNCHEYEAIFDFKKRKHISVGMNNDVHRVVKQQAASYNSFTTITVNQSDDLNRSF